MITALYRRPGGSGASKTAVFAIVALFFASLGKAMPPDEARAWREDLHSWRRRWRALTGIFTIRSHLPDERPEYRLPYSSHRLYLFRRRALHSNRARVCSGARGRENSEDREYDTDRAYAEVKKMIGYENEQGAHYWAQYLLAMPEVPHGLGITRTADEVPLTLDGGRGSNTSFSTPLRPWK